MDEYYNKHYIRVDADNIIDGWSDVIHPQKDTTGAICINEQGGYQFRLFPDGEGRLPLLNENGVYLYRYINGVVIPKTPEEIEAETPAPEPPQPTTNERIAAMEAAIREMAGEIYG